jgi:integrase
LKKASEFFLDINVKNLKKKNLRAFLDSLNVSSKTKQNYSIQFHDFFHNFLYDEEEILSLGQIPRFPKIDVELGFRKLVDMDTREKIVDKLKEMTYKRNPKIWLGVDLLCTYNNIRPGDIRNLKEGDIDLQYGVLTFWRPTKTKRHSAPKVIRIRLLDYYIEEFKKLKSQFPAVDTVLFFRRPDGVPFGKDMLYRNWKKACKEIGIYDLDLYGGTRHSSITAIAKAAGKKTARKYSEHHSNKAFDRYCQIGDDDTFDTTKLMAKIRGKVVDLKKAEGA